MIITYNYIYYYMKALKSPIHAVLSESVAIFFFIYVPWLYVFYGFSGIYFCILFSSHH